MFILSGIKTSYYYFLLKEFLLVRVIYYHFLNYLRSLFLWPSQETRFEGRTFSLFCLFSQKGETIFVT